MRSRPLPWLRRGPRSWRARVLCALLAFFLHASLAVSAQTPAEPAEPGQPRPALPATLNPAPPVPFAPPAPGAAITAPVPAAGTLAPAVPGAELALTIMADSSLHGVLPQLVQAWADAQDGSPRVAVTLVNSATIVSTIAASQPADVVILADPDDVRSLNAKGLLRGDGQHSVARNTLVLYARKGLLSEDEWYDRVGNEWKRIALADPAVSASGRIARRALQQHDLLGTDQANTYLYAPTEKGATQLAQEEKAEAVFLYRTDVAFAAIPGFDVFPLSSTDAPPIFYTAAVTQASPHAALAQNFVDFCSSAAAHAIWSGTGFETN